MNLPLAGRVVYALAFLASGGLNARDRKRLAEVAALLRAWREGGGRDAAASEAGSAAQPTAARAALEGTRVEAEKLAQPFAP